jgi:DNA-binding MarR family transcriptional regulator
VFPRPRRHASWTARSTGRWPHRLPDPEDSRKVVVHLSALGRARLSRLEALVSAHEAALAASLGADRVAALVRALGDLAYLEG